MADPTDANLAPKIRRVLNIVTALVAGAGLAVIGYFVWQLVGTNLTSAKAHSDTVALLEKLWDAGRSDVVTLQGRATAIVRIPRLGHEYAVPVWNGTAKAVLSRGYGHFTGSAEAGGVGNYALNAYRRTHSAPLRAMSQLQVDDRVVVETATHVHTYRLTSKGDSLLVPFSQSWMLAQVPTNPEAGGVQPEQKPSQRLITLITAPSVGATDGRKVAFGVWEASEPNR